MVRWICVLGLLVASLSVLIGDYAFSVERKRPFEIGRQVGPRFARTVFFAAPFFVIASFLHHRRRRGKPTGLVSAIVATIAVSASTVFIQYFLYYAATTLAFGRTGGALYSGCLLLTGPFGVTALGIIGFYLAEYFRDRGLEQRSRGKWLE